MLVHYYFSKKFQERAQNSFVRNETNLQSMYMKENLLFIGFSCTQFFFMKYSKSSDESVYRVFNSIVNHEGLRKSIHSNARHKTLCQTYSYMFYIMFYATLSHSVLSFITQYISVCYLKKSVLFISVFI